MKLKLPMSISLQIIAQKICSNTNKIRFVVAFKAYYKMKLIPQYKLNKALEKQLLKYRPLESEIALFKTELIKLLDHIDLAESEEHNKTLLGRFLTNGIYKNDFFINTKGNQDQVIHNGANNKSSVGVIIEAKKPIKSEWFTADKPNSKPLQQLVLYYLRERIDCNNINVKYLIASNIHEWYIIESNFFKKLFYDNKKFVKDYEEWRDGKKDSKSTDLFYNDIAKPFIDSLSDEIPCIYFNIREHEKALRDKEKYNDKNVNALFKILSPFHLLKVPFANDSNELDDKFYKELLHIIGLEEAKVGGKNIIRRKQENRNTASLLEKVIDELKTEGLHKVPDLKSFGDTNEEQYFNIALELCITWINRILFLKLLEGQLLNYHKKDQKYRFLNSSFINDFDELFKLFHKVLAIDVANRNAKIQQKYSCVPYLNSSLFEISDLEDVTIKINAIDSNDILEYVGNGTILKEQKKKNERLNTLDYLFQFLDAYDFASEGTGDTQEDNKTLINASVLGKVFEKINGYKDGSIYTPGFITMYMSRQGIRLAVMQKFNDAYGWDCKEFGDLDNYIDYQQPEARNKANALINDLKLCDPAVGSGHFLVSALNEIITVKSELKILQDINGKRLKEYSIDVINDELIITDEDNDLFIYNPQSPKSQLIQQTLFSEKKTIIENSLFGVDINPNSVKICRLRLWIELLKNAYYKPDGNLETLPNIDINIKCGNSLLSRFALDADLSKALKSIKYDISAYKGFVNDYKNCKDREVKRNLQTIIDKVKIDFKTEIGKSSKEYQELLRAKEQLLKLLSTNEDLFGVKKKNEKDLALEKRRLELVIENKENAIDEIRSNTIYKNAFEWRFEFPEVLNNNGDYEGFDLIIGNPPYIKEYEHKDAFNGLRLKNCYQGKMDIWYLFGDLGLTLLRPNSYLCYIATNNWVTNSGASNFRNILIIKSQIISLIDFGAYMIFENASIQTMVMIFKNSKPLNEYVFDYRKLQGNKFLREEVIDLLELRHSKSTLYLSPNINVQALANKPLTFSSDVYDVILNKLKRRQNFVIDEKSEIAQGIVPNPDVVNSRNIEKIPLTKINQENIKIGDGVFIVPKNHFEALSEKEKNYIKPVYEPYLVDRYNCNEFDKEIIYITKKNYKDDAPTLISHLKKFEEIMDERRENQQNKLSFNHLHWPRDEHFFERGAKILSVRKCLIPTFVYTENEAYVMMSFNILRSDRIDLKYLTGLLNSKLIAFWLRQKGKMQGNNFQLDKEPLLEIPIYKPNDIEVNKVSLLVNEVLTAKKAAQETTALEQQIDTLVYQLYGLNPNEIAIVENSGKAEKQIAEVTNEHVGI